MVNQPHNSHELTMAQIDAKMRTHGCSEMQWLWESFKRSGVPLDDIDEAALTRSRDKHMGAIISRPTMMWVLSIGVSALAYLYMESSVGSDPRTVIFDRIMHAALALLSVYLFWFMVSIIQRTVIYPWKTIIATDLASMLKRRCYVDWLNKTERARQADQRLRQMGVNQLWDNPAYRVWLGATGSGFGIIERISPSEYIQNALREILGRKENRRFQPGRYLDSLRSRKKSVTRFVNAHQAEITASKEGRLPSSVGIALIRRLKDTEIVRNSAGDKCPARTATRQSVCVGKHVVPAGT